MARPARTADKIVAPPARSTPKWTLEAVLILLVIAAGVALRLAYPSRMAVEHFDEGVYSSNRWFGELDGYQYPNRHLYAPPLLPALIEWSFILFGPSNFAAVLPNLIAGCLTVPLVWWLMRSWAGPRTALAAAILVAGSDLHIAFSRAVLTDALLLFWLVAAVGAGGRAFIARSWGWAILAGVLAGLGWWTKYNGWLSLAILGSGGIAWALFPGRPPTPVADGSAPLVPTQGIATVEQYLWRRVFMTAGLWGVIAATAVAVWAPYWWSLQSKGGYAAVAANHRGYFVGWSGWLRSLGYQSENLWRFSGWLTVASMALAVLLPSFLPLPGGKHFTWNRRELLLRVSVMCFMAAGMVSTGVWLLICGATAAITWLVKNATGRITEWKPLVSLAIWLYAAWFIGLTLGTPLYTPYARLVLPWWLAAVLGLATQATAWTYYAQLSSVPPDANLPPQSPPTRSPSWQKRWRIICLGAGVMGLIMLSFSSRALSMLKVPGWQPRTACETVAAEAVAGMLSDLGLECCDSLDRFAVYTYGEPALLFQLRLAGVSFVAPVEHLKFAEPGAAPPRIPSYVIVGPQAYRTRGFNEQFKVASDRLRPVATYSLRSSELVQRDNLVEGAPSTAGSGGPTSGGHRGATLGPTPEGIRRGDRGPFRVTLYRILSDEEKSRLP